MTKKIPLQNTKIVIGDFNAGIYALYFTVTGAIHFAKKYSHHLVIDFKDGLYATEKGNWWKNYFENTTFSFNAIPPKQEVRFYLETSPLVAWKDTGQCYLGHFMRLGWYFMDKEPTVDWNAQVFKMLGLKDSIQQKADGFFKRMCSDRYVIGVHYRGTDATKKREKSFDAPHTRRVPYPFVFRRFGDSSGNLVKTIL